MANALRDELGKQEDELIRSNIRRIISSYRHVWDIYTELLQNSADALIAQFGHQDSKSGRIQLFIDTGNREIRIADNGIGIPEDSISKVLATGKSLKRETGTGKHGFMGYGFTYVAFQSSYLRIASTHKGKRACRTYLDLYKYAFNNSILPNSEEESSNVKASDTNEDNGTEITIKFPPPGVEEAFDIALEEAFDIAKNPELFIAMLRTKTIVGSLDPLFGAPAPFLFDLTIDGASRLVPVGFLSIREVVREVLGTESQFYDLKTFQALEAALKSLPQQQKDTALRTVLLDEKIPSVSIGTRSPISSRAILFATSKNNINDFNARLLGSSSSQHFQIEHGLWLSINGMPTGVCLDAFDDHSNMLPFTVLIDVVSDELKQELDAGRKGISQYRAKQISEKARELLRDHQFFLNRRYVVGATDSRISNGLYDPKSELKKLLSGKSQYKIPISQKYLPPQEEQEVISIFTELCASGYIKGYSQKVLSGFQVYDGLFHYELKRVDGTYNSASCKLGVLQQVFDRIGDPLKKDDVFLEFKKDIYGLYRDLGKNKKSVNDIDVFVCWDVDYAKAHADLLRDHGDVLQVIDQSRNVFFGATYQLAVSGRPNALPIIELKSVINALFGLGL